MDEQLAYYLACVPLLGMSAQLVAWWTRLPSILLLLAFGIALGYVLDPDAIIGELTRSEETTQAEPPETGVDDSVITSKVLFPFVSFSVAVILFEGGLSLRFSELKESGSAVTRLVTLGALVSWGLISVAAWLILGLNVTVAVLCGAVLIVTGPTVVAPMMRYIRPNRRIGAVVKWEGIVIDPIGAILAVLVFEYLVRDAHEASRPLLTFLLTVGIGFGFGFLFAMALVRVVERYWVPDYLHGMFFLSSAICAFAICNFLRPESGLVTVTVMGIVLANQKFVSIDHVVQFKENLGVFLISCLFIVLGSRLDLLEIWSLGLGGVLFLLALVFVVRPVSVFVATIGTALSVKERLFLSFLAPRGIVAAAVTSVFALQLIAFAGENPAFAPLIPDAEKLIPISFLVIVGTVAIYGIGGAPLARRLGLADNNPQGILIAGASDWIRDLAKTLHANGMSVTLVDTNYTHIAAAKMDGLRANCMSILADQVHEEADMSGIGRFFALTSNDGVNSMAAKEYSHLFGRRNVYQLPPAYTGTGKRASLQGHVHGRELFGAGWDEERFSDDYRAGFRFKSTKLTDEFTIEDFFALYGDSVLILMTIDNSDSLRVATTGDPLDPKPSQVVIAFVGPDPE